MVRSRLAKRVARAARLLIPMQKKILGQKGFALGLVLKVIVLELGGNSLLQANGFWLKV